MLDLKSFHYTTATCSEVTNSISDRIWVVFSDESKVPLIPDTITFNKIAREDAAFRVSYNLVGEDGDILQLETLDIMVIKDIIYLTCLMMRKAGTCSIGSG